MSDEQPTEKELAEAAALAQALEDGAEQAGRRVAGATDFDAIPRDALEVAALLRLTQPGAALDPARSEAVLKDVLGPATIVQPARKRSTRWLWSGVGVASSFAVAALCLLMLRSQEPSPSVASAPSLVEELAPAAAPGGGEPVAPAPMASASGPSDAPAASPPKVEPLEPGLAQELARSERRAVYRTPTGVRAEVAESAKQLEPQPAPPPAAVVSAQARAADAKPTSASAAAAAPQPPANPAAARLIAAQAQIAPGSMASIAQLERAQAQYRGYLRLQPTAAALGGAHAHADSELTRGQIAAAIEVLETALGKALRDGALIEAQTDMAFRAGALALQLGDAARALRIVALPLSRAATNDPSIVSLWRLRAQAQRAVGDSAGAANSDARAQHVLDQLRAQ